MRVALALLFLILAACAPNSSTPPRSQTERTITPMEFYESFNMRTIYSSIGPRLRYYCESYPREYFTIEKMADRYLELSIDGKSRWLLKFSRRNTVTLVDDVYGGTYLTSTRYTFAFNSSQQEWHAVKAEILHPTEPESEGVQAMGTFIDIPDDCHSFSK